MIKTVLAASLVAFAAAECPNACSGHGTCGSYDVSIPLYPRNLLGTTISKNPTDAYYTTLTTPH
jgi:hypothetical protein